MKVPEIVAAWREWCLKGAQGPLAGDQELLESPGLCGTVRGWEAYCASGMWAQKDWQLQLGLLPVPFAGHLAAAKVVVLLLNPGCGPLDFFGEDRVPEYRQAIYDNLMQNEAAEQRGFFYLDPDFSWSGGFRYWHGKFRGLVDEFVAQTGQTPVEAWTFLRRSLASVELLPYHSGKFGLPTGRLGRLRSVQLAKQYLCEHLLPRARKGDLTLIVMRKAKLWGVEHGENVVVYGAGEARAAHLGPQSRGGAMILDRLLANRTA